MQKQCDVDERSIITDYHGGFVIIIVRCCLIPCTLKRLLHVKTSKCSLKKNKEFEVLDEIAERPIIFTFASPLSDLILINSASI